jgi:anti-sigma factor RsiW
MTSLTRLSSSIPEEKLSAYFDGELDPAERQEIEQLLARDAASHATLTELGMMRQAIDASLAAEAAKVPQARFEQIWDEIDRTLDRDTAAHIPTVAAPSLWARMLGVLRPVWVPVAAVGGVAAVLIVVSSGAVTPANTDEVVASKPAPTAPVDPIAPVAPVAPVLPSPALAVAPEPEPSFPTPDMHEAEIERIEFGGKNGRIGTIEGKRGTTTVIWVSDEDAGPGQRSL